MENNIGRAKKENRRNENLQPAYDISSICCLWLAPSFLTRTGVSALDILPETPINTPCNCMAIPNAAFNRVPKKWSLSKYGNSNSNGNYINDINLGDGLGDGSSGNENNSSGKDVDNNSSGNENMENINDNILGSENSSGNDNNSGDNNFLDENSKKKSDNNNNKRVF